MHVCIYLFSVGGRFVKNRCKSECVGGKKRIVHQRHFPYAWEQKQNNTKLAHPNEVHTVYD